MIKILVADDEESLRYLITETLKIDSNYDIYEAEDGEMALNLINDICPELVLLDIMMPKLSGYELVEILNKRDDKPKIIMLTAKAQKTDIERGKNLGVDYYLTKPFSPMELMDIVDNIASSIEKE